MTIHICSFSISANGKYALIWLPSHGTCNFEPTTKFVVKNGKSSSMKYVTENYLLYFNLKLM